MAATEAAAGRDAKLAAFVAEVGPCTLSWGRDRRDHFGELIRAIAFQQLAGAAARTIHGRFVALFDGEPTPESVLALPDEAFRGAGLSGSKTAAIRDLATKVVSGELPLERVGRLPDAEVVTLLSSVRGIGRWTAEMFLMFQLGRLDVWPVDDLGVRKGYSVLFGHDAMPAPKALEPLGDRFRPYRSVVAWYCWRAIEPE